MSVAALAYSMQTGTKNWGEGEDNTFLIEVELLGEVHVGEDGSERFSTGISVSIWAPSPTASAPPTCCASTTPQGRHRRHRQADAGREHRRDDPRPLHALQALRRDRLDRRRQVDRRLAALRKAIESDPKLRVLILDPHNEFAAAFPEHAVVIDTDTLDLPFWLMRLDEFAEVCFAALPILEELDILRDLMPEAKRAFRGNESALMRAPATRSSITADTPVPYRIADLSSP